MLLEKLVIPIGFDTGMLMAGIEAITGLISGAVDRTREWTEGMDALGDVTGMSEDKLAAWSFVAKKAGVEIETLSSATVIMAKGLLDSTGELSTTGKALQDFGVDVLDAGGKVRDQSDLMNDIGKKYAEFGTQTERVDFLTNVFGRSGAKLVDVFETMAQEGGIDKVREKVKDLGLVLDPTQYEEFQRNINEVDLTFTGLANAFTGPLLPGAESLLQTFTKWLQSPWIADAIANIGEKIGTLASDIATGIETGDWDKFFADIKEFTGFDIAAIEANLEEFKNASATETSAIKTDWEQTLNSIGGLMDEVFGTKGINLIVDWQAVGVTALQVVDIFLHGVNWSIDKMTENINKAKQGFENLTTWAYKAGEIMNNALGFNYAGGGKPAGYTSRTGGRAMGGSASGMTWVGERGPELVNLPSGSYVNNNQASQSMGFDYYKLASILAVEFAKARD
jgi:hypothetical protein